MDRSIIFACFFTIVIIGPMGSAVFAETGKDGSFLSVRTGVEHLEYEESEPANNLRSRSEVENVVASIDGVYAFPSFFAGLKAVFPVLSDDSGERWNQSGTLFQTNTLKYKWTRLDGYFGYPLSALFNPFAGIRYSRVEQDRSDFVLLGNPLVGSAKEKVTSLSILLGAMGQLPVDRNWALRYRIAFFSPVDVEVTNSSLPGFKANEKEGYTFELESGIGRSLSDKMRLGLTLFVGVMHWKGSDFKPFPGGSAKWPENDTAYLGGTINVRWDI